MPGTNPSERSEVGPTLALELRRRAPGAWEALYEQCGDRVLRLAHRILPSRLDPEGAAQQTWVRALHKAKRLDASRGPVPWVFSICVNLCISVIRRDRVRQRFTKRERKEAPQPRSLIPNRSHTDEAQRVRIGVAGLSRPLQQIIYLRYACQMNTADVAEVLGLREDAARKHLSRAEVLAAIKGP